MYEAIDGADALVICTAWHEFRRPDWDRIEQGLKRKAIFDGRNLYKTQRMADHGWDYFSIGRPHLKPVTE